MKALWSDESHSPLKGLKVLDCTVMLPGPLVTRLLAQHGAQVIKVENLPNGDHLRQVPQSSLFECVNQGKRSIGIALRTEAGAALIQRLAAEADLFVENFREGVLDQIGLGYPELSSRNPRLLYASIRGYSDHLSTFAGHDLNFIAHSGVGEWFLESGPHYSTQFGDIVGGTLVPTIRILSHLAGREKKAMHIVCNMDEGFRLLYLPRAFEAARGASLTEAHGVNQWLNGTYAHSRYYRCQDGHWIALNCVQDKHWRQLCTLVGRPDWISRWADNTLAAEAEAFFASSPSTRWEELCKGQDVCFTRVIPWAEHLKTTPAQHLLTTDPLRWCGFPEADASCAASALGADTFSVLSDLGVKPKEYAQLAQQGIVASVPLAKTV